MCEVRREWAGNVRDGPGGGARVSRVILSSEEAHCVPGWQRLMGWLRTSQGGGWISKRLISNYFKRKKNVSKHHEDKYAALLGEYAFWGWYLTLIWRILFHFLAVSVYDEGAVCNITLSLYHYQAGSLNTDTQPPGVIDTKHKRAIGSYSECKSTFSVPSCLIQLAKIFSMKSFPFVA